MAVPQSFPLRPRLPRVSFVLGALVVAAVPLLGTAHSALSAPPAAADTTTTTTPHVVAGPSPAYWLVASDGGVFAFGGTPFYGSMGGKPLDKPMVGMAGTHDGKGYWTVASDGGIFSFGDAPFQGSMGGKPLDKPIVGMAADPATGGYWEVASDGGIFSFGAPF
ncbi:MAG TPA: hypothetical protein VKR22_04835, partial [Acidimicrobiales bacterium]|nr:hypothetical protein [Acidimicrobiales bacterium]